TDAQPSAEVWVRSMGQEQLFARNPSGVAAASWIQAGQDYDFDLYAGPGRSGLLSTVHVTGVATGATPPTTPAAPTYLVGVDYHATTADFGASGFLEHYDDPNVRAVV